LGSCQADCCSSSKVGPSFIVCEKWSLECSPMLLGDESDRGPILEAVGPFAPRYCSPTVVLSGRVEREDVTGQIRQQ